MLSYLESLLFYFCIRSLRCIVTIYNCFLNSVFLNDEQLYSLIKNVLIIIKKNIQRQPTPKKQVNTKHIKDKHDVNEVAIKF